MHGRAEQGLFARLPILKGLALWRFQNALIDQARVAQRRDGGLDLAGAIKRLFRGIDVHPHTQNRQIIADHLHHHGRGKVAQWGEPDRFRLVEQALTVFGLESLTHRNQVVAGVQALADFRFQPVGLAVALKRRPGEHVDLGSAIVDVVFAGHGPAGKGKQV